MGVASKKKQFGINFIIHLVLIVLVVICLAPIALVVINSFKTNTEIVSNPLSWPLSCIWKIISRHGRPATFP